MVEGSQSSDGGRSPKRRKTEETPKQDRIGALPDEILLHILSFLRTIDAVKTGTLSHRWLYLWSSVPNLDFTCDSRGSRRMRKFVTFVDQTLIFHRRYPISKFTVNFQYKNSFASRVDTWVRFATTANVEELDLNLNLHGPDLYVLPQHVYTNSSITKLTLWSCNVVPNGLVSWKSLKSLSIGFMRLSEDVIQKILVGSSVLESLELSNFCGFNRLDIGAVSLRKLVLRNHWDSTNIEDDSTLEISAPNLQSLAILGTMSRRKFRRMNVQSLEDCNLDFSLQTYFGDFEALRNVLRELFDRLRHVKKLNLGTLCMQVLSILELKGVLSPLPECKCLILDTDIQCDAPEIAGLLQSSPNLETLIINMTSLSNVGFLHNFEHYLDKRVPENYWTLELGRSKVLPLQLKTLKIVGFPARHFEFGHVIPFVQFLLEKASVLEKIVINAQRDMECSPKELLQVAQKLLSLPRISPHAVVIFSD